MNGTPERPIYRAQPQESDNPLPVGEAEAILVAHQRHKGGCLCGYSRIGESHAGHQALALEEARKRWNAKSATKFYMVTVDEGWRSSILCTDLYKWAADWLVNELQGKPFAPETRPGE